MRIEGWENLAFDYIEAARKSDFVWGSADCVLFACDLAKAMTGKDPAETIRGLYASKEEAFGLIASAEYPPETVMGNYFRRIYPKKTKRGDIVFKKTEDGFSFGIVWDGKALFRVEPKGLVMLKISEEFLAWQVD